MCLLALLELLISCKTYPIIGDRIGGMFHHVPRLQRLTADTIRYRVMIEIFVKMFNYFDFLVRENCMKSIAN